MKWFRVLSILALAALLFGQGVPAHSASAQPLTEATPPETQFVPGEVVVSFQDGLSSATYQARANALAGQVEAQVVSRYQNLALLSFDVRANVEDLAAQIALQPGVTAAQPNYVYSIYREAGEALSEPYQASSYILETGDGGQTELSWAEVARMRTTVRRGTYLKTGTTLPKELTGGKAWGWDTVQADLIWDNTAASPSVCLLDTGVDQLHPDLGATRVVNGYDFINFDSVANDDNGHGTHLAGIISAGNNNLAGSSLGVSNGKVMAVKVLNAEGRGTSYSVAAGVRYCARQPSVRVINLSVEGRWPDPYLYDSLDVAINQPPVITGNKAKLVVASAGNWGNSDRSFPAAWSDPTFLREPGNPESGNVIFHGLISVTAGGSPNRTVWVDTNGDHSWFDDTNGNGNWDGDQENVQWNEFHNGWLCAAQFSNYGSWIDLIAPGGGIYSTTPVSYPFYLGYFHGLSKSYGWMEGSSQATAYVSGAAARTWAVNSGLSNRQLKERVVQTGSNQDNRMHYGVDPNAMNPDWGYNSAIAGQFENEPGYGWSFWTPAGEETVRAPYCWPVEGGTYGPQHGMGQTSYLNVAAAMGRFGLTAGMSDSHTSLPLVGATISFFNAGASGTGTTLLGTAVIPSGGDRVLLTNVAAPSVATHYKIGVNKTGYTAAMVKVLDIVQQPGETAGWVWGDWTSIPPMSNNIDTVLTWDNDSRLGMLLWLPQQTTPDPAGITRDGVLSTIHLPDYQPTFPDYVNRHEGTLATAAQTGIPEEPFAQMIHTGDEGGNTASLMIRGVPFGTLYSRPYYKGTYSLYVTDYSRHYENSNFSTSWPGLNTGSPDHYAGPEVRLWSRGRLMKTYTLKRDPEGGPNSSCSSREIDLWHAADITWTGSTLVLSAPKPAGEEDCGNLELNASGGFDYIPYPKAQLPRVIRTYPGWGEERDPLQSLFLFFNQPVTTAEGWQQVNCDDGSGERPINTTGAAGGDRVVEIFPQEYDLHPGDVCELSINGELVSAANDPTRKSEGFFLRYNIADRRPEFYWSNPEDGANLTDLSQAFTIHMSEPVDTDDGWVGLTCEGPVDVPVTVGPAANTMELTVTHDPMPANTSCTLTLYASKIRESDLTYGDQLGMEQDRTLTFTTHPE